MKFPFKSDGIFVSGELFFYNIFFGLYQIIARLKILSPIILN